MSESSQQQLSSVRVVLTALAVGLISTLLFYDKTLGLSVLLFAITASVAMLVHARLHGIALHPRKWWPVIPLLFFAAMAAVHSDPLLTLLNIGAALALGALVLHYLALHKTPDEDNTADHVGAVVDAAVSIVPNALTETQQTLLWLRGRLRAGGKWQQTALAVLRGLAIAAPILLVFAVLLASADAVFDDYLLNLLNAFALDGIETLAMQAAFTVCAAVVAAGALAYGLGHRPLVTQHYVPTPTIPNPTLHDDGEIEAGDLSPAEAADLPAALPHGYTASGQAAALAADWHWQQPHPLMHAAPYGGQLEKRKRGFRLSIVETGIILGAVDLLFGAFVAVQFAYFFGGHAALSLAGWTYSDYARRGFFELVAVAAITLGLALFLRTYTHLREGAETTVFRCLSIMIVALTLVILLSASGRMLLYEEAYGFTHLRVYTHIFMLWLGVLLGVYLLSLFFPASNSFSMGILIALIGYGATLNLINVDGYIAGQNIARYYAGAELDTFYLDVLSLDAYPAVLDLYRAAAPESSAHQWAGRWLAYHFFALERELTTTTGGTIFSANLTRANAWRDLSPLREELSAFQGARFW